MNNYEFSSRAHVAWRLLLVTSKNYKLACGNYIRMEKSSDSKQNKHLISLAMCVYLLMY